MAEEGAEGKTGSAGDDGIVVGPRRRAEGDCANGKRQRRCDARDLSH
jgi:hypothetical protein